jgi:hypothetical protein
MFRVLVAGIAAALATVSCAARVRTPLPVEADLDSIPGFGGAFIQGDTAIVYLTDTNQRERAVNALRGFKAVRVRQAEYSFAQLDRWFNPLAREVLAIPGSVLVDVDETLNRLVVGVESDTLARLVMANVARLQIPAGAVRVETMQAVRALVALQDLQRPARGGFQIATSTGICTLGVNALRSNDPGFGIPETAQPNAAMSFITASHCTNDQGGTENTVFAQAGGIATQRIGVEATDPNYTAIPFACPSGRICRFSDAARVRYDDTVSVSFGRLGRTSAANNGSLDVVGTFKIKKEGKISFVGVPIDKIGRTTGWTSGPLKRTCAHTNVTGGNITMLCQNQVTAEAGPGDSGAPTFFKASGTEVILLGILWGRSGDKFLYSTMSLIEAELGTLLVRN